MSSRSSCGWMRRRARSSSPSPSVRHQLASTPRALGPLGPSTPRALDPLGPRLHGPRPLGPSTFRPSLGLDPLKPALGCIVGLHRLPAAPCFLRAALAHESALVGSQPAPNPPSRRTDNANYNLYSSCNFVFEFTAGGVVQPSYQFKVMKLELYENIASPLDALKSQEVLLDVAVNLLVIRLAIKELAAYLHIRCNYGCTRSGIRRRDSAASAAALFCRCRRLHSPHVPSHTCQAPPSRTSPRCGICSR